MGIPYINIVDSINITCIKCQKYYFVENLNDLKKFYDYNIKCNECNKKIEVYEDNFKCLDCNHFFCQECAPFHEKIDINNILIHIYESNNMCEKHYELYTTFCGKCKSNLCNKCKEEHVHRVDKYKYELNKTKLNNNLMKNLDTLSKVNEIMSTKLSYIFEFMNDFSYSNLYIRLSLWFIEGNLRKETIEDKDFYFKEFFDKDFQEYYTSLISNISKGKSDYYSLLLMIKKEYEAKNKKVNESFSYFHTNYLEKKFERNIAINKWISNVREALLWFEFNNEIISLKSENMELKNEIFELENDIELLRLKILFLLKSNDLYSSYLMKLINRYIADFLIRKLIEKYPYDFENIEISPKNFFEIAVNFEGVLSNNVNLNEFQKKLNLKELNEDLEQLKEEKVEDLEEQKKERIISFVNNFKDNNNIEFKHDIKIKNKIYTADELNFVLNTFFYFKCPDNIVVQKNISPSDSIKLRKINISIHNINTFLKCINNNTNKNIINLKKK